MDKDNVQDVVDLEEVRKEVRRLAALLQQRVPDMAADHVSSHFQIHCMNLKFLVKKLLLDSRS